MLVTPLRIHATGQHVHGVNPGWVGHLSAESSFVVLLVGAIPNATHWSKAEPALPSGLPLSIHFHPLAASEGTFQLLFTLGFGWLTSITGKALPVPVDRLFTIPGSFLAGSLLTVAAIPAQPAITLSLLALARSDVSLGRNRIWRPHKAMLSDLPFPLHAALEGSRAGVIVPPSAT